MVRRISACLALVIAVWATPVAAWADDPAADAGDAEVAAQRPVERLHAALRKATPLRTLAQREALLGPVLREVFDLPSMLAKRAGKAWDTLDEAQRTKLTEAYARARIRETALDAGRGTYTFTVEAPTERSEGLTLVTVRVKRPGAAETTRRYAIDGVPAPGRILAITTDGRSKATEETTAFAAAFTKGGFPAVLAWLEARAQATLPAPAPANQTATQVVARLQDALLGVMREAKTLGFAGRRARLDNVVRETHYIAAIARLTVRRHWKSLSKAQQRALVKTFGDLSVANYAARFDGYSGERFTRTKEEMSGKSTIVRTLLTKSDGGTVRLDYTLRKIKGRWRILNITADGVSDLSTKQAEYGSVIGRSGFPALLAKLREQIHRYETGD